MKEISNISDLKKGKIYYIHVKTNIVNIFQNKYFRYPSMKLRGKYDALIGDATTNENLQLWKFGKNTGVEPSTSQSPESKKGFFQSFFGKE